MNRKRLFVLLFAFALFPIVAYGSGLPLSLEAKINLISRRQLITAEQDRLMDETVSQLQSEVTGHSLEDLVMIVRTVNNNITIVSTEDYYTSNKRFFSVGGAWLYSTDDRTYSNNPYKVLEQRIGTETGAMNLCGIFLTRTGFFYHRDASETINKGAKNKGTKIIVGTTNGMFAIECISGKLTITSP